MSEVDMPEIAPTATFHLTFVRFDCTFVAIDNIKILYFCLMTEFAIFLDVFFAEDYSIRRAHHTFFFRLVSQQILGHLFVFVKQSPVSIAGGLGIGRLLLHNVCLLEILDIFGNGDFTTIVNVINLRIVNVAG